MTKWEIPDAKLNPVIKLPQGFLDDLENNSPDGIPAGITPEQAFAKYQTNGSSFYSRISNFKKLYNDIKCHQLCKNFIQLFLV